MASSLRSSTCPAGPGTSSPALYVHSDPSLPSVDADRRANQRHMSPPLGSPGGKTKRVQGTAVVGYRPDMTAVTTYEVDSDSGSEKDLASSPPFLSPHSSPRRIDSPSSTISLRTPSPEDAHLPESVWPVTHPRAPRIPFPPTPPRIGHIAFVPNGMLPNVGLGISMGDNSTRAMITYPKDGQERDTFDSFVFHPPFHVIEPRYTGAHTGLGISIDNQALQTEGSSTVDDDTMVDWEDDEKAYYHLPTNLLSPELIMSTEEFKDSLRKWVERRQGAGVKRDLGRDAGLDVEGEDPEQGQTARRRSI